MQEPKTPYPPLIRALVWICLLAGLILRFATTSQLWLDEALTIEIARLPLSDLPGALRRDGSPPLYYLLLHGWINLFGESDFWVRALSGVISLVSIPLVWLAARRAVRPEAAWAATLAFIASPFAIRYATEARMYSLMILLTAAGYVLVRRSLEAPSRLMHLAVAVMSGALMLTHYWSFYLVAVTLAVLLARWRRDGDGAALKVSGAVMAGGLLFLPWLPTFLYQIAHTGTPWGRPPSLNVVVSSISSWAGGTSGLGPFLGVILLFLVILGASGARTSSGSVEISPRLRRGSGHLVVLVFGTLVVAVVAGAVTGGAYAERYSAVVFVFFVLLLALGFDVLPEGRVLVTVAAAIVVIGLAVAGSRITTQRTQAGEIAAVIEQTASADALIAYCPDQLGPAVARQLDGAYTQVTFPDAQAPEIVDWVDYAERNRAAKSSTFAAALSDMTESDELWLVWADDYRTLGTKCERLVSALRDLGWNDNLLVGRDRKLLESGSLTRFTRT